MSNGDRGLADKKQLLEQQQQRIAVQPQTVSCNGDASRSGCRLRRHSTKALLVCREQEQKQVTTGEGQVPEGVAVTVANIASVANSMPAATLLINPFTIHATSTSDSSVVQTIAVSNPVVSLSASSTPVPASGATGQAVHHHQNVRDMDIVHVNLFPLQTPFFSVAFRLPGLL